MFGVNILFRSAPERGWPCGGAGGLWKLELELTSNWQNMYSQHTLGAAGGEDTGQDC